MPRMTYTGQCIFNGKVIVCAQINGGVETSPNFYDHVVGLRDTSFTGSATKGPGSSGGGDTQVQKKIYRFVPGVFRGKISGPVGDDGSNINIKDLLNYAISGAEMGEVSLAYYGKPGGGSATGHVVKDCVVESLTINITSGDVVTFDASIVGKNYESNPTTSVTVCSKLLTWDKCEVTSALAGDVASFSVTIKNAVIPIYVSGSANITDNYYPPTALRLGMQEVSGSIATYDFIAFETDTDKITLKLKDITKKINVVYHPTPSSASGDVYVSSTPFTGVKNGAVWG